LSLIFHNGVLFISASDIIKEVANSLFPNLLLNNPTGLEPFRYYTILICRKSDFKCFKAERIFKKHLQRF